MRGRLVVVALVTVVSLLGFSVVSWAAAKPADVKIGLVDINKVFAAHPNTQKIADLEQKLLDEMQKRQAELNEKGKGKTREEVQKLEEEMNAEWKPVRDAMLAERQDLVNQRYQDIIQAIKQVAEAQGLTLVLRSEVRVPVSQKELLDIPLVFYGGVDITEQVLAELEKVVAAQNK
ncbi:OmpH family outer membrane protein [Thermatribacter velox]|uniref:OmpH family outer membrane protein n=1 Tax=Thermatribacter velox TaxID=3039681 RepID=A0ABZ2Y9H7_9BACT